MILNVMVLPYGLHPDRSIIFFYASATDWFKCPLRTELREAITHDDILRRRIDAELRAAHAQIANSR